MRVFVTGIGAVSCLGDGTAALKSALLDGRSGVAAVGEDWRDMPASAIVGLVRSVPADVPRRADAFLAMAIDEALTQAGIDTNTSIPAYIGSAHGHLDAWQLERRAAAPRSENLWDLAQAFLARRFPSADITVVSTACTASSVALGMAFESLRSGDARVALVAGAESMTNFLYYGFHSLRSLAIDGCRPFDRDRTGLVLGEGAAAIVLEAEANLEHRGVAALAEVAGYGFGADGMHLTAPDPMGAGAATALRAALVDAELDGVPDFINAHGTGTKLNDRMECFALQRVFGSEAARIPITATKPMTGHMCGAAGAFELVCAVTGLQSGFLPPILGFGRADAEFADFDFVHGRARLGDLRTAVSLNSGFGGTNTCIVLRKAVA